MTFEHIDYKGEEIYDEIVSCGFCGKDLGYFNGRWVDGGIMGICMDCQKKVGEKNNEDNTTEL